MTEMRLEPLGGGVSAYISKQHAFGTDAFLLAYFSSVKSKERVCDLCTGCGIIPLLFARDGKGEKIVGVELQKEACEQFELAVNESSLQDKISVVNSDLRCLDKSIGFGSFDAVTVNPPYFAKGSGFAGSNDAARLARSEEGCTLNEVLLAAAKLLRFGGRLFICHRPERLAEIFCEMKRISLEPKRLRAVTGEPGGKPWLVLIEAKLGGKPGLVYEKDLTVGGDEMKKVLGKYSNEDNGEKI